MAAAATMLSRVERLDLMMSYLEEMKGRTVARSASATSSGTAATTMSDAGNSSSSVNSSPKSSLEKRCRPIYDVVVETQVKGSLIERVDQLESRLLKLEEDAENERKRGGEEERSPKKKQKKGLKSLVKACVRGNLKTKH